MPGRASPGATRVRQRTLPTVVTSVLETDAAPAARAIRAAPAACGLVELRADLLRAEAVSEVVRGAGRPLIVTVRRPEDGGHFGGPETERRRMLLDALEAGAAFVDVELDGPAADLAEGAQSARVILSDHGAPCRPRALEERYSRMARSRAARLKLVPRARSLDELFAVRDLLGRAARDGRTLACFAMGRAGLLSRLLAPSWGSWASYGSIAPGKATAEGQPTAGELSELHDVTGIGEKTRLYALVGGSVGSSPSPAMHTAAYRELGLDARYFALDLETFDEVLPWLDAPGGLHGLGVTMPFKEQAARRCTAGDEIVRLARAVNTVVVGSEAPVGFNTDGPAALALVRRGIELDGRSVAVVGAGGTARAVAVALARTGAAVTLFNRTDERAREAARALGIAAGRFDELGSARWDVLVQTTPLGAGGETLDVGWSGGTVLDAVYGPAPTPLIAEARRRGLRAIDGFELLVEQAVGQFELLTGRRASRAGLAAAGRRWLDAHTGTE